MSRNSLLGHWVKQCVHTWIGRIRQETSTSMAVDVVAAAAFDLARCIHIILLRSQTQPVHFFDVGSCCLYLLPHT